MVPPEHVQSQAASKAAEVHQKYVPLPQFSAPVPTNPQHAMAALPPALEQLPAVREMDRVVAVKEIWERNCTTLETSQREALWQVLLQYKDIFALSEEEVGLTHLVQHEIDTGDAHPIKTRPRRLPLAHQAAADSAIDEMLAAGIIEPSDSPWASGVVLQGIAEAGLKLHPNKLLLHEKGIGVFRAQGWWRRHQHSGGKECDRAFCTLKKALTESPILTPPDTNLPFVMDTDASDAGMGAVLSQVGSHGEKVVAYFSKTFNKAERRYCVTRRELLAIVRAIGHFRYYLCGLPFTVRTDHSALQWLMSFKEPEGQIARWLEELAPYNFKVEYRAGSRHANADAMSRRPCALDGCRYCEKREAKEQELCVEEQAGPLCSGEGPICEVAELHDPLEWRAQQELDPDLQPVLQWVESGQRPQWSEVAGFSLATKGLFEKFTTLRIKDRVLQRAWKEPATGEERWQTVVPRALRDPVLKACHGTPGAGHFGVSKTLRRLRQGFYWGQLRRDVEDFCRRCDLCAAYKGPPGQSRAELQQLAVGAPMERVAVDIMGPFPRSDQGNRYVLAAMDYFTKWPEAFAIPDQEAVTVADTLVEGMFSRFGAPEVIHSDQGRNFESSVQESTACTPALLMLGRELRTPREMCFGRPPHTPAVPPGPEYARRLQDRMETAHAFARDQLQKAGIRQKRNYDMRAKGKDFNPEDLVWVFSPKRKKGRCPKLDCHWVGPCRVLEKLGEVVYRVQLPPRGRRVALHRDRQWLQDLPRVEQAFGDTTLPGSPYFAHICA
uniref:Gypsy retrotransposon integrase-like protein 1 n=1 Tax=Knipowitschia caucasica TaxID=637954 RepID=A0AAV2K6I4_KNICA